MEDLALQASDAVFVESEFIRRELKAHHRKVPDKKITMVPGAVDLTRFCPDGSRESNRQRFGIGAGPDCDAQVLVINDLLGLTPGKAPKFVKRYANLRDEISEAAKRYADEVARGEYPGPEHSYS